MKKLWVENLEVNPARVYEEEAPNVNFTDMSNNMLEWDKARYIMDWSRRRDMISPLFYAEAGLSLENFTSLSLEKKLIGCRYFLIPYALRTSIVSEEEDYENGQFLLSQTKLSRINCVEAMRQHVWNGYVRKGLITLAQSQEMLDDIDSDNKIDKFEDANNSLFKKWIFGLDPYVGVFASKSYYSVELQNKLIEIYNGDY